MAQCQGCNKFASYDDPEIDIDGEVNGTDLVLTGTIKLNSSCCGYEMKTADVEATIDLVGHHDACPNADLIGREIRGEVIEDTYELEGSVDLEGYSRSDGGHNRRCKKPCKEHHPYRYHRTYYGAAGEVEVKHEPCGETFMVTVGEGELEEAASGFQDS